VYNNKNVATKIGTKASIPNPALSPFAVLIGDWQFTGSHPYLPGIVLNGRASFEWLDGGAFLIMHSEIDDPQFPDGIEIFGSDDVAKKFFMLHFDQRGTSRKFDVTISGNKLVWKRDDPSFSQRCTMTIEDNGKRIVSKGEMSKDGAAWEQDLKLIYTRR
jgi:hypothetical protein